MKKLIALLMVGTFATIVSAQTDPLNRPTDNTVIQPQTSPGVTTQTHVQQQTVTPSQDVNTPSQQTMKSTREYVEMKNGKVYRYKEGKSTVVTNNGNFGDISFNGDGTVTLKDGSKIMLREGDRITSDGRVIRSLDKARTNTPDDMERY